MALQDQIERAVFTVTPHENGWAVEHEGAMLDPSREKSEALAAAHRRARAAHDEGRPARVAIHGEVSFAPRPGLARIVRGHG